MHIIGPVTVRSARLAQRGSSFESGPLQHHLPEVAMTRILWINPVGTDAYDAVAPRELSWIPVVEPILNADPR